MHYMWDSIDIDGTSLQEQVTDTFVQSPGGILMDMHV